MPKTSAGLLLYRHKDGALEVFLVHPGGPFWARKDDGAWSIPKGEFEAGEDPLDAAKRELFEEAGYRARDWTVLIDAFTSPGGSSESVRLYLARGLQPVGDDERHVGDGEERDMPTRWVPLSEVRDAVLSGRLHSPLGTMGFLAAASVLLDGVAVPRSAGSPWMRSGTPAN